MTDQPKLFDDRLGLYNPSKTYIENWDNGPYPPEGFKPFINKGESKYKFLGFDIHSPFGIPAGPLLNSNHVKFAFEAGFDVLCYKTQRSIRFEPNQFPNVLYLDAEGDLSVERAKQPLIGRSKTDKPLEQVSITNSFGNPSLGPKFWVDDLKKAMTYEKEGQLLIMSVVGTIQEGFSQKIIIMISRRLRTSRFYGVKAIE